MLTSFKPEFPVCCILLYWTAVNQIQQIEMHYPAGNMIWSLSNRHRLTHHCILQPKFDEYGVAVRMKYKHPAGRADCIDRFIRVVKPTEMMHIVAVRANVGPEHSVRGNATSKRINTYHLKIIMWM
jgi:hypothetical protein